MPEQPTGHIVIVGAGFGGLRAARALAGKPVRVTLIDRNNFHLFQPLLYQVATAGIAPDEIAYPVRAILRRQKNLTFRMAEVQRVDRHGRRLITDQGEIPYDALILAVGSQSNFFGLDSVARNALGLKSLQDAETIRNHLLCMFEAALQETDEAACQALLTFVVAGGGPSGVETAGAVAELTRMLLKSDYRELKAGVRVILLEGTRRILNHLDPELSARAEQALTEKGVEVRLGAFVEGFDGSRVFLKDAQPIPAHTLIWAAGVRSAEVVDSLGGLQGSQNRVRVNPDLSLPDDPRVFVIGDAAYLENGGGTPLPMVAPVAMQQGTLAAENALARLSGAETAAFVYRDPGSLATIGRNQAVAQIGRLKFHGFLAWAVWLVVHLMQLVGFRNRLVVLINWAWDYLFYERAVRLITPER